MERLDVEQKINAVLSSEFEVPQEKLLKESNIKDEMALDSLDTVDLLVLLEEEMSIEVDPQQFINCKTLGDIHDVVYKLIQSTS